MYNSEVDLVKILKTIRLVKVWFRTQLKQKQMALLQMQRAEVIESGSDYESDQDFAVATAMTGMKAEDPMERVMNLGRMRRALGNYVDDDHLYKIDKRLLKGFYVTDKWELVNESEQESLKYSYKMQ